MLVPEQKKFVLDLLAELRREVQLFEAVFPTVTQLEELEAEIGKILSRQLWTESNAGDVVAKFEKLGLRSFEQFALAIHYLCLVQAQDAIVKEDRELAAIAATKARGISDLCLEKIVGETVMKGQFIAIGQSSLMVNTCLAVLFLLD
jgi:hypothetical protein